MGKRLVSHFANMLYIGAVITVFAVTRLALIKASFAKAGLKILVVYPFLWHFLLPYLLPHAKRVDDSWQKHS